MSPSRSVKLNIARRCVVLRADHKACDLPKSPLLKIGSLISGRPKEKRLGLLKALNDGWSRLPESPRMIS